MPSAIDPSKPVAGSPTTQSVRDNFAAAKSEIEVLQQTAGVGPQGPLGPQGPAGTVTVNPTVITGNPGTNASVAVGGTPQNATLQFTVPRGDAGTGGGGITETQAVDAVRQGQVTFQEATVTSAPTFPTTPNLAQVPIVGTGWTPATGTATQAYTHTDNQDQDHLAYPVAIGAGDFYQIVLSVTRTNPAGITLPTLVNLYFGTSADSFNFHIRSIPTTGTHTITLRANANYTHLLVQPADGDTGAPNWDWVVWTGNFTLTRIVRAVTLNSITYNVKEWPVVVKGNSRYDGGGGRLSTQANAFNTICGWQAGETLTTASNITAFGSQALRDSMTGSSNSAFGSQALLANLGTNNNAFGPQALQSNTTGSSNCAFGVQALRSHRDGSNNIAIGNYAQSTGTRLTNCVAVGQHALAYIMWGARDNTAIGHWAGAHTADGNANYTTKGSNIFIGTDSRSMEFDPSGNTWWNGDGDIWGNENEIVIGAHTVGHGDHTITLGNDEVVAIHSNVQTISALSDSRVKTNIQPANLDLCLDAVKNLPVSRWAWQPIAGAHPDKNVTGFMADDVARVFPKAVTKATTYLPVRGAGGKVEMVAVPAQPPSHSKAKKAPPTPEEAAAVAAMEPNLMTPKRQKFDDLQYVQPTELLPTLWGAVQRLIEKHDELERRLAGEPEPKAPAPKPEPARRRGGD